MTQIIALREQQQKLVADARAILDQIDRDTPEERAKELEVQHDGYMAEHDRLEERIARLERLEAAQARLDEPLEPRPAPPAARARAEEPGLELPEVFKTYLRFGMDGLTTEARSLMRGLRSQDLENRAQAVGTATAGGYLAPDQFVAELIKRLEFSGPMLDPGVTRQIVTGSGAQMAWPTMDDTANEGAILAENTQDTEQDLAFGQKTLDAYKYTSKIIRVSEELLQDAEVDVEAVIREAMAERIGRIVNKHLTIGTGTNQPNGIVTASSAGVTAASATAITMDELLNLVHSIDVAYRSEPSCRFMFSDTTLGVIRKLKDGQGNYLWQPADARTGAPASLLAFPYSINNAMANIAAAEKAVLFGAFNRYIVRRTREFAVRRLVERYADYYQVGFLGFARFDGELLDTAAVKHLVTAAA